MSNGAGHRVMVVDDDDVLRASIRVAFEEEGWEVTEAAKGADALTLLGAPPLPDVMVLDLVMPGMDGLAVLAELRQTLRIDDVQVVVMSARKGGLANRVVASLGADDCIAKPVDPVALRARCSALVVA